MKMEGSVRSGGAEKRKGSSGCLVIKNKVGNAKSAEGVKRARLVASSSSSSDEDESLEYLRRKVNEKRLNNGLTGYNKNEHENREYDRGNIGIAFSEERERSRLDLFEFDEYDEFDGPSIRNKFLHDSYKKAGHSDSGHLKENGFGSSNRKFEVYKRLRKKAPCFDGSSNWRSKGSQYSVIGSKESESEDDEADMPISLLRLKYQQTTQEPIRLQGKNGVLKVMVNKKKKVDIQSQLKNNDHVDVKERNSSRSDGVVKDSVAQMPKHLVSKRLKNRGSLINEGGSIQKDKKTSKSDKVKLFMERESKDTDSETDVMDTVLKLAPPSLPGSSPSKRRKKEEEQSLSPQIFTPAKSKEGKEGKPKRGGSTEKQILRDRIRGMLVDAGWSIDYRPRRNRDYLDAVYINPSGTAYWSIVKAYDAFKKQLEEDSSEVAADNSSTYAPLADELINKLTRQTRKKIEEEKKRKRKENIDSKIDKESAMSESADSSESDQDEERLSSYMKQKIKSLKNKIRKVNDDDDDELSDDLSTKKPGKIGDEVPSTASKSNAIQGRTSKVIGRCTLLVRGPYKGKHLNSDGYVPYCGKRTVLAWLIDSATANLSEKVKYMNRRKTRVMLEGWITREGIHCGCCSKILTVSKFELHAGSKLRQPFQNIFLESGPSLLQCQIDAWNSQDESLRQDFHTVDGDGDDPDDDTCNLCGDGGDLICCDSCPSTFHQICLGIQMLPSGDWHCPNCICKFCGYYGCSDDAEEEDTTGGALKKCIFCEKKYHETCSERMHDQPLSSSDPSFCGQKCRELHDHLQQILGIKQELEAGFSWSLLQRTDLSDSSLRGLSLRAECNSKLAVALSIMDECFLPIIDRRSGVNIIHNVVYNCGSNFNRLNYHGFHTAILERGDEIISAASIRLHGDHLAEMPFIGTREIYRRQGMCRRLLSAIESELRLLKVGQLIIPAISEHMNTWTEVFGFDELEDVHKKEIKSLNMLVFPGTDMLQKQLLKQEVFVTSLVGTKVSKSVKSQPQLPGVVEKSHSDSSLEQNKQQTSDSGGSYNSTRKFKADAFEFESPIPAIPSHKEADSGPNNAGESDNLLVSQGTPEAKTEVENIQPQLPGVVEESHSDSSLEQNKQQASDSGGSHNSTSKPKADAFESESPIPAIPSHKEADSAPNAAGESDTLLVSQRTTEANTEVEKIQKGSSLNLKLRSDSSDMENQLPDPPSTDNISSSVEAVIGSECGSQDASRDSILYASVRNLNADEACRPHDSVTLENSELAEVEIDSFSSLKLCEDAIPEITVNNGGPELLPGSASVAAAQNTEVRANGEPCPASCLTTIDHEPLPPVNPDQSQITESAIESGLHSSKHLDTAASIDARGDVTGGSTCSSNTYINDEKCDEPFEASAENALASSNGKQSPACISAAFSTAYTSETDKPDGENKISVAVDAVITSSTCSGGETMAQKIRAAENNSDSSDSAGGNME